MRSPSEFSVVSFGPLQPGSGSMAPAVSRASVIPSPSSSLPFEHWGATGSRPQLTIGSLSSWVPPAASVGVTFALTAQFAPPVRPTGMSIMSAVPPLATALPPTTLHVKVCAEVIASHDATVAPTSTVTCVNAGQPSLIPTNSDLESSPCETYELAAHAAGTLGTLGAPPPLPPGGFGLAGGRGSEPPPGLGVPAFCCAGPRPSMASRPAAPEGSGLPQARAASTAPSPLALGPASLRPSSLPRSLQADFVAAVFGLPFTVTTTMPAAEPRGRAIATAALPCDADPSTITPMGADFTVMRLAPLTTVTAV